MSGITLYDLNKILAQNIAKITCLLSPSEPANFVSTNGGSTTATIQSSVTASETETILASQRIREVYVVVGSNTTVSIEITKSDGSTFTHYYNGIGTYHYVGQLNQAPITEIVVTELNNVSTIISINYSSIG